MQFCALYMQLKNEKRSSDSMCNLLKVPALIETMSRVNELQEQCDQHNERIAEKYEEIDRLKLKVSELDLKKTLTIAWRLG